jgi:3-oxoacyl-(acyl-carrier-protein) synthase
MGKLMKAAHLTSLRAMKNAGIDCPDAIITATSRGMLEISLQFLDDITAFDEELLKPTLFMQSTHNTLSSAIAIRTKCHGYNTTYSHGDDSFKWAMRDAERLIQTGKASSVLVGCFDESTPSFSMIAERAGESAPQDIYAKAIVLIKE